MENISIPILQSRKWRFRDTMKFAWYIILLILYYIYIIILYYYITYITFIIFALSFSLFLFLKIPVSLLFYFTHWINFSAVFSLIVLIYLALSSGKFLQLCLLHSILSFLYCELFFYFLKSFIVSDVLFFNNILFFKAIVYLKSLCGY